MPSKSIALTLQGGQKKFGTVFCICFNIIKYKPIYEILSLSESHIKTLKLYKCDITQHHVDI